MYFTSKGCTNRTELYSCFTGVYELNDTRNHNARNLLLFKTDKYSPGLVLLKIQKSLLTHVHKIKFFKLDKDNNL